MLSAVNLPDGNLFVFAFKIEDCGMGDYIYHIWTEPHHYDWNDSGWQPLTHRYNSYIRVHLKILEDPTSFTIE
jgi:hypothetical protein